MKEPVLFKPANLPLSSQGPFQFSAPAGKSAFHFEVVKSATGSYLYEFNAEEGASLEVVFFQNAKLDAELSLNVSLKAQAKAQVFFHFVQEGALKSEINLTTECAGEGSNIQVRGLHRSKQKQKHLIHANAIHRVPHTVSDLQVWCAASDESQSIFNALITIDKSAPFTEAFQKNRNLLLSERATIDTFPKLFISNSEVKCAHGSSTSTLDEDQYYYLQSRGIDRETASTMLVNGFVNQAISGISNEEAKARVSDALFGKGAFDE